MDVKDFVEHLKKHKYLCVGSDTTCNVYTSLRNISSDIDVDYTTISKKMKAAENNSCVCTCKRNGIHYRISLFS